MKTLFYASLVLPAIYIAGILTFFLGLVFGFDIADVMAPHNDLVFVFVASLTALFVAISILILWKVEHSMRLRIQWTGMLIFGNMYGVPLFLSHVVRGHLPDLHAPKTKRPMEQAEDGEEAV